MVVRGQNSRSVGKLEQKLHNILHRAQKIIHKMTPKSREPEWMREYESFNTRYAQMLAYRELPLDKDVVSREALWRDGWPLHRIRLHEQLHLVKDRWQVRAQLTEADGWAEWAPETKRRLGQPIQLDRSFEVEILSSRLPVLPTGAHWGWRGIMFLILCAGNRSYIDRPMYEPYFHMDEFDYAANDGSWTGLEQHLREMTDGEWDPARRRNQAVFDRRLTPEAYADYMLSEIKRRI